MPAKVGSVVGFNGACRLSASTLLQLAIIVTTIGGASSAKAAAADQKTVIRDHRTKQLRAASPKRTREIIWGRSYGCNNRVGGMYTCETFRKDFVYQRFSEGGIGPIMMQGRYSLDGNKLTVKRSKRTIIYRVLENENHEAFLIRDGTSTAVPLLNREHQ